MESHESRSDEQQSEELEHGEQQLSWCWPPANQLIQTDVRTSEYLTPAGQPVPPSSPCPQRNPITGWRLPTVMNSSSSPAADNEESALEGPQRSHPSLSGVRAPAARRRAPSIRLALCRAGPMNDPSRP
jgi:hypothetical protein